MQKVIVPRTIDIIESNLQVARRVQQSVAQLVANRVVSRKAFEIARSTDRLSRLEALLLCWSCVRYSELEQIEVSDIVDQKPIVINQGKTGETRRLGRFPLIDRDQFVGVDPNIKVRLTDYDSTRRNIKRAVPNDVKKVLQGCKDSTHVFRHLRASWMFSRGRSYQEIKEFFAHKSEGATREYIHESIFE